MAVRALQDKVADLVGVDKDSITAAAYNTHINLANNIVDDKLGSSSLSEELLTDIETLLAAHFVALSQGPLTRYRVGESEEDYRQPDSKAAGFLATNWGQQAVALDPTGILAGLAVGIATPKLKAEFRVI
jgi:hypothetical protein